MSKMTSTQETETNVNAKWIQFDCGHVVRWDTVTCLKGEDGASYACANNCVFEFLDIPSEWKDDDDNEYEGLEESDIAKLHVLAVEYIEAYDGVILDAGTIMDLIWPTFVSHYTRLERARTAISTMRGECDCCKRGKRGEDE